MSKERTDGLSTYLSLVTFASSLLFAILVSGISSFFDAVRAELVLATGVATILFAGAQGVYRTRMVPDTTSMLLKLTQSSLVASALALLGSDLAGFRNVDVVEFAFIVTGAWTASVLGVFAGSQSLKALWRRGIGRSNAIVVGTGRLTDEFLLELRHRRSYGVDVVGLVHVSTLETQTIERHGDISHVTLEDLPELVEKTGADRIIIGPSRDSDASLVATARWAGTQQLPVFIVPRFFEMGIGLDSLSPDRVRGYPLVRIQRSAHPRVGLLAKRGLDVVVSLSALVLLSPVLLMCAIAVKVSGPGPVLFKQDRVGQNGKPVVIAKFRSMTTSETSDTEWTAEQRVTKVGAFLRRSSLDELPQLLTIFRGEMSLVGPRPERPAFVREFSSLHPGYEDRHRMPIGLTGLAQVVGLSGDTSIEERIKYDNLYIDQWSFGGDLQIIVKTVWSVLRQPSKEQQQKELESILTLCPESEEPMRNAKSAEVA